jgi:hypothetical protein
MKSTTLRLYIEKYYNDLQLFLDDYEDNNESLFLKNEYVYYYDYFNILMSISSLYNNKKKESQLNSSNPCYVCDKLKDINIDAYNKVFTNNLSSNLSIGNVDEIKLDNLIKSAKEIIDFIAIKQNRPQNHKIIYKDYFSQNKHESVSNKQTDIKEINPYPKIFKDFKSYTIFKNLLDEFGDTSENLANYSFIFHKMTYQGLIHHDLKQQSYYDFLSEFDIFIDRIKSLKDIGKMQLRESIYVKVKDTVS